MRYSSRLSFSFVAEIQLRLRKCLAKDLPVSQRFPPTELTSEFIGSTESNEAVNISLVVPGDGGLKTLHSFNPKMTYSIFGEQEMIFGYQGLKINLRYNACDMRPGLQIMYTKKFKTVGETSPTDLREVLEPYLPKSEYCDTSSVCDC